MDVPIDRLCTVIAPEPRRYIPKYFEEGGGEEATLEELATVLTEVFDYDERPQRLKVRLHHVDLPKLDDAGLVEYDPYSKRVEYRGHERVGEILSLVDDRR